MADTIARSFIHYALYAIYAQHNKEGDPKLWMITKTGLQKVFGNKSRIGSAQREQMQEACLVLGVAMAELSDRFIFFAPEDVESMIFDMTKKTGVLKKITAEFDKLKRSEAEKEWARQFEKAKS
jgi:hypothetical protein